MFKSKIKGLPCKHNDQNSSEIGWACCHTHVISALGQWRQADTCNSTTYSSSSALMVDLSQNKKVDAIWEMSSKVVLWPPYLHAHSYSFTCTYIINCTKKFSSHMPFFGVPQKQMCRQLYMHQSLIRVAWETATGKKTGRVWKMVIRKVAWANRRITPGVGGYSENLN